MIEQHIDDDIPENVRRIDIDGDLKLIYVGEDKIKPGLVTVRKLEYY